MLLTRRQALAGLFSALAAPVIVRAASLMPVKAPPDVFTEDMLQRALAAVWESSGEPDMFLVGRFQPLLHEWKKDDIIPAT